MAGIAAKAAGMANKVKAVVKPQLEEFWKYAKVELSPPLPADFKKLRNTVEKTRKEVKDTKAHRKRFTEIKVGEAFVNTLVFVEIITWFFMGEVIGRRHFVGYKV